MQLDRALGATELRPVVRRQAQINHRRIQTDQLVLEAEFLLADRLGCDSLEQAVGHLLEQCTRTTSVGVGKRRTRWRFDAEMGELALATLQPAFDLAQGMGAAQLAEQHPDKLAPTRQPLAPVFSARFLDDAFEVGTRDELEYLPALPNPALNRSAQRRCCARPLGALRAPAVG